MGVCVSERACACCRVHVLSRNQRQNLCHLENSAAHPMLTSPRRPFAYFATSFFFATCCSYYLSLPQHFLFRHNFLSLISSTSSFYAVCYRMPQSTTSSRQSVHSATTRCASSARGTRATRASVTSGTLSTKGCKIQTSITCAAAYAHHKNISQHTVQYHNGYNCP
jgi:hypothetical protein